SWRHTSAHARSTSSRNCRAIPTASSTSAGYESGTGKATTPSSSSDGVPDHDGSSKLNVVVVPFLEVRRVGGANNGCLLDGIGATRRTYADAGVAAPRVQVATA